MIQPHTNNQSNNSNRPPKLVILTGAGISAESGIPTFRSNGGLWHQYRFEELATPEAFYTNPSLVWEFYQWRQQGVRQAKPNQAHMILATMQQTLGDSLVLISQNVDDLHQRAGSHSLMQMHGEIMKARCTSCGIIYDNYDYRNSELPCKQCLTAHSIRPHIVWFGEMPFFMEEIQNQLTKATLFLAIGTSGAVYPAAQFVHIAKSHGSKTALINLDPADNTGSFDQVFQGKATEILKNLWEDANDPLFYEFR